MSLIKNISFEHRVLLITDILVNNNDKGKFS